MTMLLNNGMYKGQRILSETSVKELRAIQTTPDLVKYVPGEANGFQYALGAWAPEGNDKEATVLSAPSLGGTMAAIDFCRGYAFVYLLKELNDDQKVNAYNDIKTVLDEKFSCK